jgi:hypothetical protein
MEENKHKNISERFSTSYKIENQTKKIHEK